MPELTRVPVLADITNEKEYVPPSKTEKLNDLDEPSIKEIEETHGLSMTEDYYCTAGRGKSFTSARIRRARKQPVLIAREIPHCPRPWSTSYRGSRSGLFLLRSNTEICKRARTWQYLAKLGKNFD